MGGQEVFSGGLWDDRVRHRGEERQSGGWTLVALELQSFLCRLNDRSEVHCLFFTLHLPRKVKEVTVSSEFEGKGVNVTVKLLSPP